MSTQLSQCRSLLQSVTSRGRFTAALCASGDRLALSKRREAMESVKQAALMSMLTEVKADTGGTLDVTTRLQALLESSEAEMKALQAAHVERARMDELMAALCPLAFDVDIARESSRYMPGTRLDFLRAVDSWIGGGTPSQSGSDLPSAAAASIDPADSRVFWIKGGPGTGKSCISAVLCEQLSADIVAVHFCRHDEPTRKSAARMVKSIAYQLACRLPAYGQELSRRLPALQSEDASLDKLSALELWAALIVDPLAAPSVQQALQADRQAEGGVGSAPPRRMVILIDALDESSVSNGRSELVDLLSSSARKLPAWLSVLVTSRPEHYIVSKLAAYKPKEIVVESATNLADIRLFLSHCLRKSHAMGSAASEEQRAAAVELMMSKAAGLFLLARLLMQQHDMLPEQQPAEAADSRMTDRDFAQRPLSSEEISRWPAGLDAFYREAMQRVRDSMATAAGVQMETVGSQSLPASLLLLMRVLRCVLSALQPMSLQCIAELCEVRASGSSSDADPLAVYRILAVVRSLFPVAIAASAVSASPVVDGCSTVSVYHKSVKDWFVDSAREEDEDDRPFAVDERAEQAGMASSMWSRLVLSGTGFEVASADSASSSTSSPSAARLPALCLDELHSALHSRSPTVQPDGPSSASASAAFRSTLLYSAVALGPSYAVSSGVAAAMSAFLCHPQMMHMRAMLQLADSTVGSLSVDYLQAEACSSGTTPAGRSRWQHGVEWIAGSLDSSSSVPTPAGSSSATGIALLTAVSACRRFYATQSIYWAAEPELVYQQARTVPTKHIASRLAAACLLWLTAWPHRSQPIALLQDPPSAASALLMTLDIASNSGFSSVHFSPDGSTILAAANNSSLYLWDSESGELQVQLEGHTRRVLCADFSHDSSRIASGSMDKTCRVWDSRSGTELLRIDCAHMVNDLQWSGDDALLVLRVTGLISIHDAASGALVRTIRGETKDLSCFYISPNGEQVVTGGEDDAARLWRLSDGAELRQFPTGPCSAFLWSKDGSELLSVRESNPQLLRCFDALSGAELRSGPITDAWFSCIAWMPGSDRYVVGIGGGRVVLSVFDTLACVPTRPLGRQASGVTSVACHPRLPRAASCGFDAKVCVWAAELPTESAAIAAAASEPSQVGTGDREVCLCQLSVAGERVLLVETAFPQQLHLHDAVSGKRLRSFGIPGGNISAITLSQCGCFALSTHRGEIWRWHVASGAGVLIFRPVEPVNTKMQISQDDRRLLCMDQLTHGMRWFELTLQSELPSSASSPVANFTLPSHAQHPLQLIDQASRFECGLCSRSGVGPHYACAACGYHAHADCFRAAGGVDTEPRVQLASGEWQSVDVGSGGPPICAELWTAAKRGDSRRSRNFAFNCDSQLVACCEGSHIICVYSASTGAYLYDLLGHEPSEEIATFITAVAFHPTDPALLATADNHGDFVVRQCSAAAGTVLQRIPLPGAPANYLSGLAWSPDGSVLLAASMDSGVWMYDPASWQAGPVAQLDCGSKPSVTRCSADGTVLALCGSVTVLYSPKDPSGSASLRSSALDSRSAAPNPPAASFLSLWTARAAERSRRPALSADPAAATVHVRMRMEAYGLRRVYVLL